MKFSQISVIAILLVMIAVSIAGCTSSSPAAPAAPATGGAPPSGAPAPAAAASAAPAAASGPVSAASVFGNLGYEWAEYKMVAGEGADQMTIFYKYNHKTGKCSMRFEGANAEMMGGMVNEMDCSSTGPADQSAGNPNDVSPDMKLVKVGTESVTVPAGTFLADKYTATANGVTATYWIANGKPLLKMMGGDATGTVVMELNDWG